MEEVFCFDQTWLEKTGGKSYTEKLQANTTGVFDTKWLNNFFFFKCYDWLYPLENKLKMTTSMVFDYPRKHGWS